MNDEQPATPQQPAAASAGAALTNERILLFMAPWLVSPPDEWDRREMIEAVRAMLQSPPVATAQQSEAPK